MNGIGRNQTDSGIHNRSLLLKLIKQRPGLTRKELTDISGLTKPAVSNIVNAFLENGVIVENQNGNVRNKGLQFAEGHNYIISMYLGRLAIKGRLYDLSGNVICSKEDTNGISLFENDNLPETCYQLIESIINESNIGRDKIIAVGIAAPYAMSSKNASIYNYSIGYDSSNSPIAFTFNWGRSKLVHYLEEKTNLFIRMENSSNLSALAELWFGKGVGVKNLLQYSIGLGIGGGAIIDGNLYKGHNNRACEVGHTSIVFDGVQCYCGNKGCLEAEAGLKRIVELYDPTTKFSDYESVLSEFQIIMNNARHGEHKALEIISRASRMLGAGAVNLVNMFNPEKLVICTNDINGLSLLPIMEEIAKYIRTNTYSIMEDKIEIEISELGNEIQLLGGYALILENLYPLLSLRKAF